MESAQMEEALNVLTFALSQIKWRLKPSSKLRLEIDVLALCSGMRPLVMVDYGGKMPELQQHLCSLLDLIHKESTIFQQLRVMVIEDMIYLLNVREFAEYVIWSLSSDAKQYFVDLEQDPPKMISTDSGSSAIKELVSVQNLFLLVFTSDGVNRDALPGGPGQSEDYQKYAKASSKLCQGSEALDFSSCMQDNQITIPTLNGWLLGYPVVYLFGKDHISDAIYNLSTKPLRLYKVLVHRNAPCSNASPLEELMSFSVPYDLSMEGRNEPWAEAFWLQVEAKREKCKQMWRSLKMEILPTPW
ncbi:uncharacterized protein [Spinacia oleracea]|uniref:Uncharacterized protein isoform X2 n=1 Tax=Spinacia oleracea TaxID=3562 RepID=A0ABM3RHJ3_SPIOL|nr:uncharacterized protein LOC110776691 isoform X2 [Spinacia oleracea]